MWTISPWYYSLSSALSQCLPGWGEESWPRRLKEAHKDAEQDLLLKTLQSLGGNRTRAAEFLGISLRGLHYKLKRLPPADIPLVASNGTSIPGRISARNAECRNQSVD